MRGWLLTCVSVTALPAGRACCAARAPRICFLLTYPPSLFAQAGILEGSLEAAVHQPVAPADATPPSKKGRGRGKAPGSRSPSASKKGRGRGKAAAAAAAEEQHESGSETDASEDLSHARETQRVLAKEERAAPPTTADVAVEPGAALQQQAQQEEQPASAARRRGKKGTAAASPAVAATAEPAGKAAAGGRKRRAPEPEEQEQEEQTEVGPTPAKRPRQAAPAAAAPAVMPAAEGWHNRGAGHPQPPAPADEQASPDARTAAAPAAAAGAAASAAKPMSAAGRRAARRGAGPATAAAAEAAAEAEAAEGDGEEEMEEVEVEEDGPTRVCYASLIVAVAPPPAALSNGADDGPNFKAFRKADTAVAAAAAAPRPVIACDAQPYEELNQPSAEAFLKCAAHGLGAESGQAAMAWFCARNSLVGAMVARPFGHPWGKGGIFCSPPVRYRLSPCAACVLSTRSLVQGGGGAAAPQRAGGRALCSQHQGVLAAPCTGAAQLMQLAVLACTSILS